MLSFLVEEGCAVPSEAEKYWQYSRECTKQAVQAETPELRDQLLDLARVWTQAALCEEINARAGRAVVARHEPSAARHARAARHG